MSSVRMCDRCGNIFSENDLDWSTATGTVQRRRENGTRYGEQTTIDQCGPCTNGVPSDIHPKLPTAIAAGKVVTTAADEAAAAEREDDHAMLRDLQRQLDELRGGGATVADPAAATTPGAPGTLSSDPARF